MYSVTYGNYCIEYSLQEMEGTKSHFISVDKQSGVVLKGYGIARAEADKFILKKARWIIDKLQLVKAVNEDEIVTGSRIPYLGKKYYAEVITNNEIERAAVDFTHSKFIITVNTKENTPEAIKTALELFYKEKVKEKVTPRIKKLSKQIGLVYTSISFRKLGKRWGSCTGNNSIIVNPKVIQLPFTLIDYLILHELSHIKIKNHSKAFWAELAKHCSQWKELDEQINQVHL